MFGLRTIVGGAALLAAASFAVAAPASAESGPSANSPSNSPAVSLPSGPLETPTGTDTECLDFLFPGTNIRAEPNTGSAVRGQGNPGDCVDYHGAVTGQNTYCPEGSFWTDQWNDVTNERTGVRGLVVRCYIG